MPHRRRALDGEASVQLKPEPVIRFPSRQIRVQPFKSERELLPIDDTNMRAWLVRQTLSRTSPVNRRGYIGSLPHHMSANYENTYQVWSINMGNLAGVACLHAPSFTLISSCPSFSMRLHTMPRHERDKCYRPAFLSTIWEPTITLTTHYANLCHSCREHRQCNR